MSDNNTSWLWRSFMMAVTLTLFCGSTLFAQGTLKGKVTDVKGEAVIGANVFLSGTTMGAATDFDGNYVIKNVPAGSYTLTVSAVGFKSKEFSISLSSGAVLEQNVTLEEDVLQMESVVITGTAGGI